LFSRKLEDIKHSDKFVEGLLRTLHARQASHFTAVVIHGIKDQHLKMLQSTNLLCESLADIYHYYLNGPAGTLDVSKTATKPASG
jgi:hypothetical protein